MYELRAGDEVIATLRWEQAFGTLATAESADGVWTFKREGFFQPRVTIRRSGSETNVAVFRPRWTGSGVLEFPDGRAFHWKHTNFWYSQWAWEGANGGQMLRLKNDCALLRSEGHVEVESIAQTLAELPLLTLLGWYLILLLAQDTAATAAVVVAT
jgi:hypothetical protein